MKRKVFNGTGVAIVTPFQKDGSVNYSKFAELLEEQIEKGTDCLIVAGTTGEASTMPDEEHLAVIRFAVEQVRHRVPVMAGAGSNDTKHGVNLIKRIQEIGADALLLVTPYYNKTTQKGLYEHFGMSAEAVDLPIVLYNIPSRTGLNMAPETVAKLAEHYENIVGVKECVFDQIGTIKYLLGDDFAIYTGEDALAVPTMAMGGSGVISVLANLCPEYVHSMMDCCLRGDYIQAGKMQVKALPLIKALFAETSPIPIKYAMNQLGMEVGECRMPLTTIGEACADQVNQEMNRFGLL